jgi:ATP-dependent exoDNAse (exonuclease V) alpha subunit
MFATLKVALVVNLDKVNGHVNGMLGVIVDLVGSALIVRIMTGQHVVLHPYTDTWGRTFYPLRLAYAVNLSKVQGETLSNMTLWLDTKGIPGAAYVAFSRLQTLQGLHILGRLTPQHFQPVMPSHDF